MPFILFAMTLAFTVRTYDATCSWRQRQEHWVGGAELARCQMSARRPLLGKQHNHKALGCKLGPTDAMRRPSTKRVKFKGAYLREY